MKEKAQTKCSLFICSQNVISRVEESVFGSFVEHIGRSVYNGIYQPEHATADKDGIRIDVTEAVKELGVSLVRYPGGNFLSGYDWRDGIGDKSCRPVRTNLAWKEIEPNTFGTDEFMKFCEKAGTEPMMAVNMGTGTARDAADLTEYCNLSGGTYWSEKRKANGHEKPYDVKYWCVGNEMDGCWQMCAMPAEEYGRKANEAAKLMKFVDPSIKTVLCGSSSSKSPTFPVWDRKVLEQAYDNIDFLSLHTYYTYADRADVSDFLASPADFDRYIRTAKATCDYVKAAKKSGKDIDFAVDEWNVWHTGSEYDHTENWTVGKPCLENVYDYADALCVAGLLTVLVNNSDRVKVACLAQLVNVIAPILTSESGVLRQSTFYPFREFSARCRGLEAIDAVGYVPTYKSASYGDVPALYKSVCYDAEKGEYVCFFVNPTGGAVQAELTFDRAVSIAERKTLKGELHAKNSFENPDCVSIVDKQFTSVKSASQKVELQSYSFEIIKFK